MSSKNFSFFRNMSVFFQKEDETIFVDVIYEQKRSFTTSARHHP